jgi:hypothetical protein
MGLQIPCRFHPEVQEEDDLVELRKHLGEVFHTLAAQKESKMRPRQPPRAAPILKPPALPGDTYYIAPDDRVGQEAFAVIRETMRKKKMVGMARVVLQRRERILMIEPFEKGLLATSLRYGNEVRQADAYFEDVPDIALSDEMIELASRIIERKEAPFDPTHLTIATRTRWSR